MTRRHTIRVRYGECDMQGVVFNAHYLAYCDDAVDTWFRAALPPGSLYGGDDGATFDFMLKTATLTWERPLAFGDVADLDCAVARWGSASFDVAVDATVDAERRFSAVITYVSVDPGTHRPCRVPDDVRAALAAQ